MKNENYKRCINCRHHLPLKRQCGVTGQPILVGESKIFCCGYWELNEEKVKK